MRIDDIRVGPRHRRDVGDVRSLAGAMATLSASLANVDAIVSRL